MTGYNGGVFGVVFWGVSWWFMGGLGKHTKALFCHNLRPNTTSRRPTASKKRTKNGTRLRNALPNNGWRITVQEL